MGSNTLCPAVHILGFQTLYSREEGISDHYWPWALFFLFPPSFPFFFPSSYRPSFPLFFSPFLYPVLSPPFFPSFLSPPSFTSVLFPPYFPLLSFPLPLPLPSPFLSLFLSPSFPSSFPSFSPFFLRGGTLSLKTFSGIKKSRRSPTHRLNPGRNIFPVRYDAAMFIKNFSEI